jgi:CRP/FNR family transcriptional regulator, cyclic AMP receptor protein
MHLYPLDGQMSSFVSGKEGIQAMEAARILAQVPIFDGLVEEDLRMISALAHYRKFPGQAMVVCEGEAGDSIYVILEGSIKVVLGSASGREVILDIMGEGEFFGELAVLDRQPRSASIITLKSSRFMVVPGSELRACIQSHPEIALRMLAGLSIRVRRLSQSVRGLALDPVYSRVVEMLRELARREGSENVIEQRPSQQTMGEMVGASREMVGRILRSLVDDGYISTHGRRLVIHRQLPTDWKQEI